MSCEFEEVVDRCQRDVFSYACYLLADRSAAEDVAQEAFLRLWRNWESIDVERVSAWLVRVTRNLCFDRMRHHKAVGKNFLMAVDGFLEAAPDRGPGPVERAEAVEFRRCLRSALDELTEPMKSVLILREVLELRYREIAEALELPLNTVRVYVHRGRKKLRARLEKEYQVAT